MRELDQEARDIEYANMGMSEFDAATQRDRFMNCGRILAAIELEDPNIWDRMVDAAIPQDDYSTTARVLGFYPLAAPLMKRRAEAARDAAMAQAMVPKALPAEDAMRLWTVRPVEDQELLGDIVHSVRVNALGYPNVLDAQWRALAERYAPQLWIETTGTGDLPAAPMIDVHGAAADPGRHWVNYLITYARMGPDLVVQVSYSLWFKSDEASNAGPIDGLIWRVTFDRTFQPVAYESLHASGRDHRWYLVQPLQERGDERSDEPEFVAPELASALAATVHISARTHELVGVVKEEVAAGASRDTYELRPYEELYKLLRPGGGTQSLFGPDGLIPGTYGVDPIGGFASGIRRPGALRQYGNHAIAHVGRRSFDDPYLLQRTFVLPRPMPKVPENHFVLSP